MKWETSLRPVKQGLGNIGSDLNFVLHDMSWISKWEIANFLSSILPTQEWSQGVLGYFGKLVIWSTTHLWNAFENSSWN